MPRRVLYLMVAVLAAVSALPAAAQDIEVFKAESVEPVQSESVQPMSARGTRYVGTARNGNYTGDVQIDLSIVDEASGRVQVHAYFSNGLSGDVTLTGTLDRNRTLRAKGNLGLGFERYEMTLQGQISAGSELTANYTLTPQGNGQIQRASLAARKVSSNAGGGEPSIAEVVTVQVSERSDEQDPSDEQTTTHEEAAPVTGPVGTWGLGVDGVAYDMDLGNVTLRTLSSGVSGLHRLTIKADGTYQWDDTRGKWRPTGDGGYPIELIQSYEGKNWRVGRDTRTTAKPGGIIVWDGSTWFTGYPAR